MFNEFTVQGELLPGVECPGISRYYSEFLSQKVPLTSGFLDISVNIVNRVGAHKACS